MLCVAQNHRLQAHRHCCLTWIFCVKWNMRDQRKQGFLQTCVFERAPSIIKFFLAEAAIELGSVQPEMARE